MRSVQVVRVTVAVLGFLLGRSPAVRAAAPEEKPKDAPVKVTAGKDGFSLQSEDGSFVLKLTGFVQADARVYVGDPDKSGTSAFLVRRARPIVTGTVGKYFDFNITPDFGGGQTVVQDAFVDTRVSPAFRVKAGKFKGPVGLEQLLSDITLPVIERGLPTNLVPNRDVGVLIHGDIAGGIAYYQAGIFNGVLDGGSLDTDLDDNKDFEGRLFLRPFKKSSSAGLKGLGLGVGGSAGKQTGAVPVYRTVGLLTFFSYVSSVTADGSRSRIAPQASYDNGPLRLIAEWTRSQQRVRKSATETRTVKNTAWQVSTSVVLTGETPTQGLVTPKKSFDPRAGTWGAVELAARYSQLDADADAYAAGYADSAKSAQRAQEYGIALGWYLSRNLKYMASYDHTTFEGGAAAGANRKGENALFFRGQVIF